MINETDIPLSTVHRYLTVSTGPGKGVAFTVMLILVKYRIPAMYLFGSYVRGDATEDSDLDFLIDTTGTELTSLLRPVSAAPCDTRQFVIARISVGMQ